MVKLKTGWQRCRIGKNLATFLWLLGNLLFLTGAIIFENAERFYMVLSILGALQLVLAISLTALNEGSFFNPLIVYDLVMFMFLSGQCLMWIFTEEYSGRNLIELYHMNLILDAQKFNLLAMFFFHLGVLAPKKRSLKIVSPQKGTSLKSAMFFVGKVMLCVTIIPEIVFNIRLFTLVQAYGYEGIYDVPAGALMSLFLTVREFFFPAVVLTLCGDSKNRRWLRNLLSGVILLDVAMGLYAGSRSDAIMQVISLMLMLQIVKADGNKASRGTALKFILVAVCLMVISNVVRVIRTMPNRSLLTFLEYLFNPDTGDSDPLLISIIGELGTSMGTLLETMSLVPYSYGHLYGSSYLLALTWLLPGFLTNNAWQAASMNTWLDTVRYTGSGWGFSTTAEAYYNFGFYGVLVFLLIGWVVGKMFRNLNHEFFSKKPVEFALSFILFNRLLIFSRIDFLSALPSIVYFYFCIKIAIHFIAYVNRRKGGGTCLNVKESL